MKFEKARITMFVLMGVLFLSISSVYAKTAEEYLQIGNAYYHQGNVPQAISAYTQAIEINPSFADAYENRGLAYVRQHTNYAQAISDFTKAIEINPNYAEAYSNRGNVYIRQDNLPQAISDFTKAVEINPKFASAYYTRSMAYYTTKEYDKAWIDVHKSEELGFTGDVSFLNMLKRASGRDK